MMIELINLTEIFIETHNTIYDKYKKSNATKRKKYKVQERYLSLLNFTSNSCYWTKFNIDPKTNKYKKDEISGKYLNEIHNKLVDYKFYEILYKKLIDIYLKITNYESLNTISQDSMFARNILGINCKRNPQYYNKPGLKIHSIVDLYKTPLSIELTESTDHDSHFIESGIKNSFVDKDIFYKHCHKFLADSSYNTDLNTFNVTDKGLNVIFGRNKQHIKNGTIIEEASTDDKNDYKKRGTSENFFGSVERYPCIINIYEKTRESYKGLVLFVACTMLAKKINNIITEKNNIETKKEREENILKRKNDEIIRKKEE